MKQKKIYKTWQLIDLISKAHKLGLHLQRDYQLGSLAIIKETGEYIENLQHLKDYLVGFSDGQNELP